MAPLSPTKYRDRRSAVAGTEPVAARPIGWHLKGFARPPAQRRGEDKTCHEQYRPTKALLAPPDNQQQSEDEHHKAKNRRSPIRQAGDPLWFYSSSGSRLSFAVSRCASLYRLVLCRKESSRIRAVCPDSGIGRQAVDRYPQVQFVGRIGCRSHRYILEFPDRIGDRARLPYLHDSLAGQGSADLLIPRPIKRYPGRLPADGHRKPGAMLEEFHCHVRIIALGYRLGIPCLIMWPDDLDARVQGF